MTPKTTPTPKFAIGDVVQLKSGGPLMTICSISAFHSGEFPAWDTAAKWFNNKNEICVDNFTENCLQLHHKSEF